MSASVGGCSGGLIAVQRARGDADQTTIREHPCRSRGRHHDCL